MKFKQTHDWPIAFASVALRMSGNSVETARVVMGAVAPIPWRSPAAEPRSRARRWTRPPPGRPPTAALGAKPMSGNTYKVRIASTAVERAILKAGGLKVV